VIGAWTKGIVTRQVRRHVERIEEEVGTEFRERAAQARSLTQGFIVYKNVRRQQEGIKAQLRRGDIDRAAMFAEQLITSQLQSGGPRYAAMSLCALAQEAKTLHQHNIQLEWLRRAVAIAPDDAWAHGQAGDAYLAVYRLNEAYQEYEMATQLGAGQFGLIGVARVLRANGRLDEALEICTRARDEFPDHAEAVRAWAIYSEILRDMWKFEDALSSYDESIKRFPQENVLWCGRAAVLTDMGRLDEALDAYARAIAEFPNDPVARGGKADVLKITGRLDEALADYEDAIRTFPEDPVLVCGRADVLREQGRYDQALAAYFEAMKLFPYEPTAFSGYAEVLKDQGNLEEALSEYDGAIEKFPQERWCRNGRASVLRNYGRLEDALKAYDDNVRDFPYDLISLSGRANLLKCLGYYDEALKAYDVVIPRRSDYAMARVAKAAIYVILGQFDEADKLLPTSLPYTNAEWIAFHIRGMMHLKRNQFQEAIGIFIKGALQVPFYRERDYFQNALAVANIRMKNFTEALQAVKQSSGAIAQVLQIHCYSELGMQDAATAVFAAMNDNVPPSVLLLRDELAATYKLTDALPRHTPSWLAETEIEVLLQAA
jgi:tetratricopeptide (TPR) repeat protein